MRSIEGQAVYLLVADVWGGGCCTFDVVLGAANECVQRTVWINAFDIQKRDWKNKIIFASLTEFFSIIIVVKLGSLGTLPLNFNICTGWLRPLEW